MMVLSSDDVSFAQALARKVAQPFRSGPFFDDLVSAGLEVAVRAARDYVEPVEGGSRWRPYLAMRVRGAVIDEIRALSHHRIRERHGIEAALSLDEITRYVDGERERGQIPDPTVDVEAEALAGLERHHMVMLIGGLPSRDAAILRRRFVDGATQKEIGDELGLHNSRICQLEATAVRKLGENAVA